jgi:alpha-D-ribose 1-methylphosphonate 5-triphosphate synthase subunit PhnG
MVRKTPESPNDTAMRQYWMGVLARASEEDLDAALKSLAEPPRYHLLRSAETGLAMVRARMGGTGRPFNLGEMTITRCSVRTEHGHVGHAHVAGRRPRHAELAALFDGLMQEASLRQNLLDTVIHPLRKKKERYREIEALKTAETRVDFFTLVRGEG